MPRKKRTNTENTEIRRLGHTGMTPESREEQLIALATDLAEQQLLSGTASSQVITHYLKLGSTRERLEKEIMEKQRELIEAKTDAYHSAERDRVNYGEVMNALKRYNGIPTDDEYR